MKQFSKLGWIFSMAVMALSFLACSDDDDKKEEEIEVDNYFTVAGEKQTIESSIITRWNTELEDQGIYRLFVKFYNGFEEEVEGSEGNMFSFDIVIQGTEIQEGTYTFSETYDDTPFLLDYCHARLNATKEDHGYSSLVVVGNPTYALTQGTLTVSKSGDDYQFLLEGKGKLYNESSEETEGDEEFDITASYTGAVSIIIGE